MIQVQRHAQRQDIEDLLGGLRDAIGVPATIYLIGDTTHIVEGWLPSTPEPVLAGAGAHLEDPVRAIAGTLGVAVRWEHPGDVIPLPQLVETRHRDSGTGWDVPGGQVAVLHFDPYSVVARGLVRGDEPDYHTALRYLRHGWVTEQGIATWFGELIERFTLETIAQDPAEFRRKLKGLMQMWRAESGGR